MNDTNMTLRDIKPLLEIPDSSFYIYYGLITLAVFLVLSVLFFALKIWWERRRDNLAKKHLTSLKAIDWKDAKQSAYKATYYARLLATDERRQKLFEQLVPLLDQYKYKKDIKSVDDETLKYYNLFVQVADESL